jgi:DNA-binding SARP family transcriptional activator
VALIESRLRHVNDDVGGAMFEIRMFGPVQVRTAAGVLGGRDFGGVKPRQILALLGLNGALNKGELADRLWQGRPPTNYLATVESYVSVLRRRLDPGRPARRSIVTTRNGGYALDTERVRTDVDRFDELLAAAAGRPPEAALPSLLAAVEVADQPLLVEEEPDWADEARERYRARLEHALVAAAEHALTVGDARTTQDLATRAVEVDPLSERAWYLRMAAYQALGSRIAALRAYDECRRVLADRLGVTPSPPTRELFLDLLRAEGGASGLDGAVSALLAAARDGDPTQEPCTDRECRIAVVRLLRRAAEIAAPGASDTEAASPTAPETSRAEGA